MTAPSPAMSVREKAMNGLLLAIVKEAGGKTLEGFTTTKINVLQRVRELRAFADAHSGTWEHWRVGILNDRENLQP